MDQKLSLGISSQTNSGLLSAGSRGAAAITIFSSFVEVCNQNATEKEKEEMGRIS
jgi:hypothetical protein